METEDGASNADKTECAEGVRCLQSEVLDYGLLSADGRDLVEGVRCLKTEVLNNGVAIADGIEVVEGVQCMKIGAVNNGVVTADKNDVAEQVHCLKGQVVNNGVAVSNDNVVAEGCSGGVDGLRTYKRRRHTKLSLERKVQDCRAYVEVASHLADQAMKESSDVVVGNTSYEQFCLPANGLDETSCGQPRNVVQRHLHRSFGDDKGHLKVCIRETLLCHPEINCATTVMETHKIDKDGKRCSLQSGGINHRLQNKANGHVGAMSNECSIESKVQGVTLMCQHLLSNVIASEKFSSMQKLLCENFQGVKLESVCDFSVLNSRIKEGAYEQSPTLFLSDIQQVWTKLQNTGNEIVSLAKSLSDMSRTSYYQQVGVSKHSTFEDEKQEFRNQESNSHMKPEHPDDCGLPKICTCRGCGDKADGTDCLVCDSCEEVYHVSCIEPAVKEIPCKSWYCANCTATETESAHENCVVCERLNVPKTLLGIVGDGSLRTNKETLNELEESSNCTNGRLQASINGNILSTCKICGNEVLGENVKICDHDFCVHKYYHVRCLTNKQLKLCGACWYCPSCLCQVCLTDQDDDKIVLCDGCDHAYHIYCMKPPQASIPKGNWFCSKCDAGIRAIHQARKAYESIKKRKTGQDSGRITRAIERKWNKHRRGLDKGEGMDMLLTAAHKLNWEEKLDAI